ncbi:MAG: hypothetical protein HWN69_08945 [Desulfobacterales bacterium]|nr:hypothetical protein [Desulfobacterales bacterium]
MALANMPEAKQAAWLVRVGSMEEHRKAKKAEEAAKPAVIRRVTETYAQIKLLDIQIAQINDLQIAETLQRELILARAELESKRTTKFAELREAMNLVPRHAFARKPVEQLSSWLKLDVIDGHVYVFNCSKPFYEKPGHRTACLPVKLMLKGKATAYIKDMLTKRGQLPVRIDILRNVGGLRLSEELHKQIIGLVKNAELEMEVEVHLHGEIRPIAPVLDYAFRNGKLYRRGFDSPITVQSFVDDTIIEKYIKKPKGLPLKLRIEYDAESKVVALGTIKAIKEAAEESGVENFVMVEQKESSSIIPD